MAPILNSAILNLAILDSAIVVFPLKLTPTCQDWFLLFTVKTSLIHSDSTWWWQPSCILPSRIQPFCIKKITHSFWLTMMMGTILNCAMLDWDTAILDSDTLFSSLRFTQKHSHSTLMLTQTNSIWLKLFQSHLTWWWQPFWIPLSWIWQSSNQPS